MTRLEGLFPALTTPFAGEGVALERLRANLACYESTGVAGYLLLGSTGEAALLDEAERRPLVAAAREAVPPGKPLIVGVLAESTAGAARQARDAGEDGADAVLLGVPHYYRDQMTPAALLAHFTEVAERSPVPVLLYNVPKFTALPVPADVVGELSRHENVAGMKDSSGDLGYLRGVVARAATGFRVLCGDSSVLREALAAGASGAVLAAAAVFPEPLAAIVRSPTAGEADRLQHAVRAATRPLRAHGIAGIKAAMDLRGLHGGTPRAPLRAATPEARAEIERGIERLVSGGTLPRRTLAP